MSEPYLGEIILFAGNFAIRGYAICEGQLLPISQNSALFSILGTTYGGDGRTTFKLPDLRGRVPIQQGSGPGLPAYTLGESSGNYQHTLNSNELPPHNHVVSTPCNSEASTTGKPDGAVPGASGTSIYNATGSGNMAPFETASTGAGAAFSVQNPFVAINYLIALTGVFPSRS